MIYVGSSSYLEYHLSKSNLRAFLIADSEKKAVDLYRNIKAYKQYFKNSSPTLLLPSDVDPLDTKSQMDINRAFMYMLDGQVCTFVLPKDALELDLIRRDVFLQNLIKVKVHESIDREKLIEKLYLLGYIRVDFPEFEGEFSVKGNFITLFLPYTGIVEIDLWGDVVESIYLRSKLGTRKSIDNIQILPIYLKPVKSHSPLTFYEVPTVKLKEFIDGDVYLYDIEGNLDIKADTQHFSSAGSSFYSAHSIGEGYTIVRLPITKKLVIPQEKTVFLPESVQPKEFEFEPLTVGDYIIHEDFGIGIYRGIETKEVRGRYYDFMVLEYAQGEKVFVSYLHLDKIHRYKSEGAVKVDRIGSPTWRNLKKKVKEAVRSVAKQLINLYSERRLTFRNPLDTEIDILTAIEEGFEYPETPDQMLAIESIKQDFRRQYPMDRLLCGDVGFGKTEVAVRASAIAVLNGYQVAVLTPTTVLSYQHYRKFKKRLEPFGIKVENLSRLKTKTEQKTILEDISKGKVDIVVATHRILQEDVEFSNLGLLIVDEEHRFGVRAKEKLRQLKKSVDTLYISATPIPRTLNMVISNLKDISVLNTPPEGRFEVKTYVSVFNDEIIKKAVNFELGRKGQVFFVHNRVESIKDRVEYLRTLFPQARVEFVHGKMKPSQIEERLVKFIEGQIDILVSTSIVETGVDIPSANTLIVERADSFGLTQLYHLRGRVGRSDRQAYCYLLLPEKITEEASQRIKVLMKMTRPGSGLKVSLEDLKLRGPGNIFGVEQSGYIKAVGFDMYLKLLKEVIQEESGIREKDVEIDVDFDTFIPKEFIQSPEERLNIYLAISKASSSQEIESIREYLREFYGGIPEILDSFINIKKLQNIATNIGFRKVEIRESTLKLFYEDINPELLIQLIRKLNPLRVATDSITFHIEREKFKQFLEEIENVAKRCKIDNPLNI